MKLQIKNKYDNSIIYECEAVNLTDIVLKAIQEKVNLSYADLSYADLSNADLSNADLSNADLSNADLSNADLSNADLMTFQFQRHQAFYTFDGTLRIGCIVLPISEWVDTFEQIGLHEQYTDEQIDMYGDFINICYKHFLNNT